MKQDPNLLDRLGDFAASAAWWALMIMGLGAAFVLLALGTNGLAAIGW